MHLTYDSFKIMVSAFILRFLDFFSILIVSYFCIYVSFRVSFRRAEGYGGRGWNRISEGQVFMKNDWQQVKELRHITDEKNNIRETIRL